MYRRIIEFWFEQVDPAQWFRKDPAFDAALAQEFGALHRQAGLCELFEWRRTAEGRLAEVIILDQFSRNICRDTPGAFAQDPLALALAQEAVSSGADQALEPAQRKFLYMPYMHSESPRVHQQAEALFATLDDPRTLDFERRHKAIIDRFGRYPHRNAILGRESTPEELAFLKQPGSGF